MSKKRPNRPAVHLGKKRSLQIAETEIERLREAYAALNSRAEELEEIAATRFRIFTERGICLQDQPFEYMALQAQFAGGDVMNLHNFTGRIEVRPR